MKEVPILLLVFNRPDTTKRVLHSISSVKPERIYIAADGPRKNVAGDTERCKEVREMVTNLSWDCKSKTLFREKNLGCKRAVSSAINWFFEQEEYGVILEDDCVPDVSFYRFSDNLLYRYKNKDQVMTISGNNFQPVRRSQDSYYFSKYMHCWGWATWRRAWKNFDLEMQNWPEDKKSGFLQEILSSKSAVRYWERIFDRVYQGEIDSWAYIWQYSIWKQGGLNILPEVNLVKNIGFSNDATHTGDYTSPLANLETQSLSFPLSHPDTISVNKEADQYTQNQHFQSPLFKKIIRRIKKEVAKWKYSI